MKVPRKVLIVKQSSIANCYFDKDEGGFYPTRSSLHRYIVSTACRSSMVVIIIVRSHVVKVNLNVLINLIVMSTGPSKTSNLIPGMDIELACMGF